MNSTEWMLLALALTALCAMVLDQYVVPELQQKQSPFRSFETYIDDLLAGNGARTRRAKDCMLD